MMHVLSFILAAFAASAVSAAPLPNYDPSVAGALGGGHFPDTPAPLLGPALGNPSATTYTVTAGNPAFGIPLGGTFVSVPSATQTHNPAFGVPLGGSSYAQ
ncbi:hypothetical protein BD413DRAFT_614825 [Trametes elegans]|nr:hypothetical protein BD413DRAFT_614825 [Trametes elegans]